MSFIDYAPDRAPKPLACTPPVLHFSVAITGAAV